MDKLARYSKNKYESLFIKYFVQKKSIIGRVLLDAC